ncbi:hydrogen peroxide-inducible genes activator [Microvirga flavescens]|uniref:hydrogen peroxide-inducible genes activator n=1 Tax=Microvirga flavescens TaxID=2249811 RepID=UPI000DD90EBC|nr:hydrogen peroxide-inducible genes activator [Microvirga flavescens]
MVNISVRQLRYFLALADTASFSKAAKRVGVTQSTLSAAIQEMEAVLGVRLVDRSGRHFELMATGELLARQAREILARIDDLPASLSREARPLTTRLRLGVIPSIAPFLLPRALPHVRAAFPELHVAVREGLTQSLIADIRSGNLDAAIIALPFSTTGFQAEPLCEDEFFVAVSAHHRLADRANVSASELEDEQILLLESGHCLRDQILSTTGIRPPGDADNIKAMSLLTLVQLAENDLGITFLPRIAIAAGIAQGTSLSLIPYRGKRSSRTLALIWRAGASRTPDYLILAKTLRELCRQFLDADVPAPRPAA